MGGVRSPRTRTSVHVFSNPDKETETLLSVAVLLKAGFDVKFVTGTKRDPTFTEKVHGRARAPSRQTRRVAANEVRSKVAPRNGGWPLVIFSNGNFLEGHDHIFVTPHPSELMNHSPVSIVAL
jgi:hypothetical protein